MGFLANPPEMTKVFNPAGHLTATATEITAPTAEGVSDQDVTFKTSNLAQHKVGQWLEIIQVIWNTQRPQGPTLKSS